MEWICTYTKKPSHYIKKQSKYFCFIALHLYRSFLIWLYEVIVKPLEKIVEKFLKNEPTETQWVHFYSLTTCYYTTDFGTENVSFNSMETYLCPLTKPFDLFVQKEYDMFLNHSVKQPKYDYEFEQTPEIIETLFVARKDDKYIFRTFPVLHTLRDHHAEICVFPEKSNIQFVIIEYRHPKMYHRIELKIPNSFYLVGNEILSPAFIQRMLELQRNVYVFDFDYEVMFIDDDMECIKLQSCHFVKLGKTSYTVCTTSKEEKESPIEIELSEEENVSEEIELSEEIEESPEEEEVEKEVILCEDVHDVKNIRPPLSNTFIFTCCVLMGSVLPLAQILNDRCGFLR